MKYPFCDKIEKNIFYRKNYYDNIFILTVVHIFEKIIIYIRKM